MTLQEKTLLFFDDYLGKLKVDYMIFASSLLRIIREGKLLEAEPSIDICVHGNDIGERILDKFKKEKYWRGKEVCKKKYGEMYLSRVPVLQQPCGHMAITPLWKERGIVYQNPVNDECIVWAEPKYYDKKTWSTIKYLGRKFKVPSNPEKWLEMWYGKDWKTPLACSWRDNKGYILWKEIWVGK